MKHRLNNGLYSINYYGGPKRAIDIYHHSKKLHIYSSTLIDRNILNQFPVNPPNINNYKLTVHGGLDKIDTTFLTDGFIEVVGYAYTDEYPAEMINKYFVLINPQGRQFWFHLNSFNREDVTSYFNTKFNQDKSGFEMYLNVTNIPHGEYKVAIYCTIDFYVGQTAISQKIVI